MPPRGLRWVILLAAALHAVGMARSPLPAQDGLKFIRVAKQFQSQPWLDVIRSSDQHPLYPAAVAVAEPAVARLIGDGADAWRIAAQGVSSVAAMLTLLPLYGLTRVLFDERTAVLAALLWAILPLPSRIGHDTLSDSLALLAFATALRYGVLAWVDDRRRDAPLAGLAAGAGYWIRPEIAVVGVVSAAMIGMREAWRRCAAIVEPRSSVRVGPIPATLLALGLLGGVGLYAVCKGELSEKLSLRRATGVASKHDTARKPPHWLPPGLDDPRWDFSPKEEATAAPRSNPLGAVGELAGTWSEAMGWVAVPLLLWGLLRCGSRPGQGLIAAYAVVFSAIVARHAMTHGYLSSRHTLTLALAAMPWAAAGLRDIASRLQARPRVARMPAVARRAIGTAAVAALIVAGQSHPAHASRWGHQQAGRWLAQRAATGDAVLDTRGWAAFLSGCRSYDPWHVRQAFSDSRLRYIVIGMDELTATSRRAATWRAILNVAGTQVASFPARRGERDEAVRIYRFDRPRTWEVLTP